MKAQPFKSKINSRLNVIISFHFIFCLFAVLSDSKQFVILFTFFVALQSFQSFSFKLKYPHWNGFWLYWIRWSKVHFVWWNVCDEISRISLRVYFEVLCICLYSKYYGVREHVIWYKKTNIVEIAPEKYLSSYQLKYQNQNLWFSTRIFGLLKIKTNTL